MLRNITLSLVLALHFQLLTAQINVGGGWLSGTEDAPDFNPQLCESLPAGQPGTGWQAGLQYEHRLKSVRISVLPGAWYSQQQYDNDLATANSSGLHLEVPVQVYFLDLKGDCDCPTFRRQGPKLQKGLYFYVSGGYSLLKSEWTDIEKNTLTLRQNALQLGAGLGIDFGISDNLTISPWVGTRQFPALQWTNISLADCTDPDKQAGGQWLAGIKVGWRRSE